MNAVSRSGPLGLGRRVTPYLVAALLLAMGGMRVSADDASEMSDDLTPPAPRGSLMIIGGFERMKNEAIWDAFLDRAGGTGARIAVFPLASDIPQKNGDDLVEHLNGLGADAFLVPAGVNDFDRPMSEVLSDEKLIADVRQAQGVFFIGGEQGRSRDALLTKDGGRTPMLDAVWEVYRGGGVIAGSSAGAAIMSRVMFRNAPDVLSTMVHGVKLGVETDHGLGFLPRDWFVDQHFLVRGRIGRALVAMRTHEIPYGFGIDEDTALVVDADGEATVVGYRGVVVIDLSDATSDKDVEGFNLKQARLSYLGDGDSINLKTREVTPSQDKLDDRRVDPNDSDFRPYIMRRLFCGDILGNMAVCDMLCKLIDCRYDEGHGLAFDAAAARLGSTPGFEFRFYRDKDSLGWNTEISGNDEYTVLNIHLDVRPVTIKGPLYE